MEQEPVAILLFFAIALFLAAVVIFLGAGEGVNPLSVVLGIFFGMLGGAFVQLGLWDGEGRLWDMVDICPALLGLLQDLTETTAKSTAPSWTLSDTQKLSDITKR